MSKSANVWDDTVFVVIGDHGENIGDHGLTDHQYSLHDTLIHVPLVIHGNAFTGGKTVDELIQLTDIAPTLLDTAGVDIDEFEEESQGRSFHPDTETEPREYAFAEYLAPQPSMEALEKRVGDLPEEVYKYDRSLRAIRSHDWKLIRGSDGSTELYHVSEDPKERVGLASKRPEKVSELEAELSAWLGEQINDGRRRHAIIRSVELPPLLFDEGDFCIFERPAREPNFVTNDSVTADVIELNGNDEDLSLDGKLVLIPQADPGYDWLFGHDIAGLITKYGGSNSHMAVRAAEFSLPAAIGVGENRYDQLRRADVLKLNCDGRYLEVLQ